MFKSELQPVDVLKGVNGLSGSTISRLKSAGFHTVESILVTPLKELIQKSDIGDDTAERVLDAARSLVSVDFITARELYEQRKNAMKLTTGCRALDGLLDGGVETQAIVELIGEYGTGKSQICMMLSVTCQLPRDRGGLGGGVLFIDTEGTFSPNRVYAMAQGLGLNPEQVLSGIIYARAYNSDHQIFIVDNCSRVIEESNVKLIIVDSVVSHFRGEYVGRESLAERQQKLNMHLHRLLRLAEVYNLAVVVTNQVLANPQAFFSDPNRPAGGNVLAHASTHRVLLKRKKDNVRQATVIDSPSLPSDRTVDFMITGKGIEDVSED
ncbi:MAG: DNA repair and recombination protein RadA [Candidatus Bathyarchaeia archaeon]